MADPKKDKEQADDLQQELRENVSDAYAFIEGAKATQTFSAITFEDLMDQQIERLVGKDTEARPNALHRIDKMEQKIVSSVAQIKKLPPQFFNPPKETADANTPEVPPE